MWKVLILMSLLDIVQFRKKSIAKKYRSHSATRRRAHWSLKTRWGMLPSNIACTQKNTSTDIFFLRHDVGNIVDGVAGMLS